MKKIFLLAATIAFINLFGQAPNLSGDIHINTELGIFKCKLIVDNIPAMEDCSFVLHKGMNIKYIKANDKVIGYHQDFGVHIFNPNLANGIATVPHLESITKDTRIEISYTGAFPVYDGINDQDYADSQIEIAFKEGILRAAYNTLWYPLLFDRSTKNIFSAYTYELNITSNSNDHSLFISGNPPHTGGHLYAVSHSPNSLLLYVGNYRYSSGQNVDFLNSPLTKEQEDGVSKTCALINTYYYSMINTGSNAKLVLGQIFSKGRENQYKDWAIAQYPIILADLGKIPSSLNPETNLIEDPDIFRVYAHELAHQFWTNSFHTEYPCWTLLYSESFSEFFALRSLKTTFGNKVYFDYLKERYFSDEAFDTQFTPLNHLSTSPPRNVDPYYRYYPILLIGMEQIIGEDKMNEMLNYILNDNKKANLNYDYLKHAALTSGITTEQWSLFETQYIMSENALQLIIERL